MTYDTLTNVSFIRHPAHIVTPYPLTWDDPARFPFNSRSQSLDARQGICTFLRTFTLQKQLVSAALHATALGIFDLYLNGERIGCDELKPGWTDYTKRVMVYSYDITAQILSGDNLLAAEVSNGWWSSRISFGYYGYRPLAFCCKVILNYTDGTEEIIETDDHWQVTSEGPIRTADIWDGCYYDARRPLPYLQVPQETLVYAVPFTDHTALPSPLRGPTVRVQKEYCRTPCSATVYRGHEEDGTEYGRIHVHSQKNGIHCERTSLLPGDTLLLDFGQNIVGRPSMTFTAPRDTTLTVYFAEMLNDSGDAARHGDGPQGSAYLENYRSALSRIVYVSSGERAVNFSPKHVFYGYRYLEITVDRPTEIETIIGEVLSADLRQTSSFNCSDAEVNRLFSNILWGQRGNYLSIPTDCPQRDERLGWTGDTQIFCVAGAYNADIQQFMRKWLQDARDSQKEEGGYPDVIPTCVFPDSPGASAGWGDAGIIVPYHMYVMYHDTELLREHFASMEKYMEALASYGGPRPVYGDWLNYDHTDNQYIADCYYIYDAALMQKHASVLSQSDDDFFANRASHYAALHKKLSAAFAEKYIVDNDLTLHTQTAYLLALHFDIVPQKLRPVLTEKLRNKIIEQNYTLSTGFIGTGILCQTLSEVGLDDLCYSLLLQTADPSWLYSVRQGATTVWERWNSYTASNGFGNVSMNSFNHYAYGAVAEWLFARMVGIMPDEAHPGFSHFFLCPTPDLRPDASIPAGQKRITYARAHYDSCAGRIESAWEWQSHTFVYRCTIPKGSEACVILPPLGTVQSLTVNQRHMTLQELGAKTDRQRVSFPLGAGSYEIRIEAVI